MKKISISPSAFVNGLKDFIKYRRFEFILLLSIPIAGLFSFVVLVYVLGYMFGRLSIALIVMVSGSIFHFGILPIRYEYRHLTILDILASITYAVGFGLLAYWSIESMPMILHPGLSIISRIVIKRSFQEAVVGGVVSITVFFTALITRAVVARRA